MNVRHFSESAWRCREVKQGGLMEGIGNRMEPIDVSTRLFGDVRTTTSYDAYDDAEVTEVQVQM